MHIITLIENTKNDSLDLINEKGISLYIEKNNKQILFDTGKSSNFIINAQKLGIDIKNIDAVILSHAHNDHGGGVLSLLKLNKKCNIYMKKECQNKYFFKYMFFKTNIGIDKNIFKKYFTRITYIDHFTEIMNNVYIITDISKKYTISKGNKYMFMEKNNKLINDNFEHELIMVIKSIDGLSIFSGCSHSGIANILETVKYYFPNTPIKHFIGGLHLIKLPVLKFLSASKSELNLVLKKINEGNIQKIYTGHCTGKKAYKKLKKSLGDKIEYISTGTNISI